MANISEDIGSIRQAESEADIIVEEANKKSTEMIQEARAKVDSDIEAAKEVNTQFIELHTGKFSNLFYNNDKIMIGDS